MGGGGGVFGYRDLENPGLRAEIEERERKEFDGGEKYMNF